MDAIKFSLSPVKKVAGPNRIWYLGGVPAPAAHPSGLFIICIASFVVLCTVISLYVALFFPPTKVFL